ncbi:MAG: bifunctional metallophosphatase/5'-nucleotidase [Deltaproteobacteria bacterium]|nr:bifunctional metallophosphatase/5'-nucleotidase [Deltaproteobacteria bacterium]
MAAGRVLGLLPLVALFAAAGCLSGCGSSEGERLHGQVRLTLLHTSDIHSRLFPYSLQLGEIDSKLGLGETDAVVEVGGAARISHIIGRERARAWRVLHLDSGDVYQGAPIFNYYGGEPEIRTLAAMGIDAMVVGNHEFDRGALNLGIQLQRWASFPALAANYLLEDPSRPGASPLGALAQPTAVFDLDGLRVGVIGMGSLSSLSSIYDQPNRLGVLPLQTAEVAQFYVDLLRPMVDLVVVLSHLGIQEDQRLIAHTTGIDVVLGGHNHIVLQPPKKARDCGLVDDQGQHYVEMVSADPQDPEQPSKKERRRCWPRPVVLAHSGAFAKYVGRLDLVVSDDPRDFEPGFVYDDRVNGFELVSYDYQLFPVGATVPDDPIVRRELEPYAQGLDLLTTLDLLVGYAPEGSPRFSTNSGDSPLGNLISTAMWLRLGIQTDFSLTNTTGIRANLVPGPVEVEQMFNIFPFDNSITKMQLSGKEVQELFDYVARRSSGRGCVSQAQIAGARVVLDCMEQDPDPDLSPGKATHIYIGPALGKNGKPAACSSDADCAGLLGACDLSTLSCWQPIDPMSSYELATSNYLAGGGSGYRVLQRNTTQLDTKVQQRDALIDYLRSGKPCGAVAQGELAACETDADCATKELGEGFVCACPDATLEAEICTSDPGRKCARPESGPPGQGHGACVLARCRDDVARYQRRVCANAPNESIAAQCAAALSPCAGAGEQCKFLACIDRALGNFSDGRIRMVGK